MCTSPNDCRIYDAELSVEGLGSLPLGLYKGCIGVI